MTYHVEVSDDYVKQFDADSSFDAIEVAKEIEKTHSPVVLFEGPIRSGLLTVLYETPEGGAA